MEPKKVVLVIGNGFDLDLGLKTKFSDFAKSHEWEEMYVQHANETSHFSLLNYLNDKKDIDEWFDIEKALLEYVHIKTKDVWIHDVEKDKHDYHIICDCLSMYLKDLVNNSSHNISKTCAAKVLQCFQRDNELRKVYTFNYTPLSLIERVLCMLHPVPFVHVHGSVETNSIILGIETNEPETILPKYDFLFKTSNPSYKHSLLQYDMTDADEVVLFGHSMNLIDAVFFEDYLQGLTKPCERKRRLTIVTKDYASQQSLLNNIRRMGVPVPKLFAYAQLEFILTNNMDQEMKERFENLLKRSETY